MMMADDHDDNLVDPDKLDKLLGDVDDESGGTWDEEDKEMEGEVDDESGF